MKPTKENIHQLVDGEFYWVKRRGEWSIGRYDVKYKQFSFTDRSMSDIPTTEYVDPVSIKKHKHLN